jgi:two-component system, LytTR family, sensor kinase
MTTRRFEIMLVLGWWALFGVFFAVQSLLLGAALGTPTDIGPALGRAAFAAGVWAAITLAAFALARRFPIDRRPRARNALAHVGAGMTIATAEVGVTWVVGPGIGVLEPGTPFMQLFFQGVPANFIFYWLLVGIGHGLEFYRRYRQREQQAAQLGARLAQAELHLLKSQLHPHFLFNTLHAISALMHRDVQAADRMIARLSDLLRAALDHAATMVVPLHEELEFLDAYLAIERIRLGDRLTVQLDIAADAHAAEVPHMLLQPLVENAVRHGIAPRTAPGRIVVRGRADRRRGTLLIEVEDDGIGARSTNHAGGGGLGLANTRARLEQLYGADFRLETSAPSGAGFLVTLRLPLRIAENGASPAAAADSAAALAEPALYEAVTDREGNPD